MARSRSTFELIPSARRLIRSLRDVGYDFKHAVADLVDNSIAAGASLVAIDMRFLGVRSFLRIADNGAGMNGVAITEAMRFGTEREYETNELGRFGLGLKTASLSQCSRLTVASRTDPAMRRIEARQWDLAHVEKSNRWEVIDIPVGQRPDILVEPLHHSTGTVVLWEMLDRVLDYKVPEGERARNGFLRLAEELDLHLGMVFHRFISGEARQGKKLRITLNGTEIEAWDPFARDEKATRQLPVMQFAIRGDKRPGLVTCRPYILPRQDQFSSLNAFNRFAGPRKWNQQQGLYIFRADRLIQSGGWSYMRTADEHTKLARIALDFWPDLDSAFDVNVSKARVNLPADLRVHLEPVVEQVVKEARAVYSTRPRSNSSHGESRFRLSSSDASSSRAQRSTTFPSPRASPAVHDSGTYIARAIENAASIAGEDAALKRIKRELRKHDPQIATDIGW